MNSHVITLDTINQTIPGKYKFLYKSVTWSLMVYESATYNDSGKVSTFKDTNLELSSFGRRPTRCIKIQLKRDPTSQRLHAELISFLMTRDKGECPGYKDKRYGSWCLEMVEEIARAYNCICIYLIDASYKTFYSKNGGNIDIDGEDYFILKTGAGFYTGKGFIFNLKKNDITDEVQKTNVYLAQYQTVLDNKEFLEQLQTQLQASKNDSKLLAYLNANTNSTCRNLLNNLLAEIETHPNDKHLDDMIYVWKKMIEYMRTSSSIFKLETYRLKKYLLDDDGKSVDTVFENGQMIVKKLALIPGKLSPREEQTEAEPACFQQTQGGLLCSSPVITQQGCANFCEQHFVRAVLLVFHSLQRGVYYMSDNRYVKGPCVVSMSINFPGTSKYDNCVIEARDQSIPTLEIKKRLIGTEKKCTISFEDSEKNLTNMENPEAIVWNERTEDKSDGSNRSIPIGSWIQECTTVEIGIGPASWTNALHWFDLEQELFTRPLGDSKMVSIKDWGSITYTQQFGKKFVIVWRKAPNTSKTRQS